MHHTTKRLLAAGATLLLAGAAHAGLLYGPYKDINMALDPARPLASTRAWNGQVQPLVRAGQSRLPAGTQVLTLAFASGECGSEHWGKLDGQKVADANIAALRQANVPYIVSTGGEGGVFTCASADGMRAFVARYDSPLLRGLDFDIEAGQTEQQIRDLVQAIAQLHRERPALRLSFTLATFAASDAGGASLNAHGQKVMQVLRDAGLVDAAVVNLMVMNYGPAKPAHCVVRASRCDMAASARQAVANLRRHYGLPPSRIAVTAMLGVNDVTENVFTPDDAYQLARFARKQGLAGLHYWSLDRDTPCPGGATAVSPTCSSLNRVPVGGFAQAFARGLR